MLSPRVRAFLTENHQAVLATFRANGAVQMSIVTSGPYGEGAAFTTTESRAKLRNLRRNPRCSLLVSYSDWRGYLVLDGRATVMSADNTDAEELRVALRDIYRATAGKEHPDWEEYDEVVLGRAPLGSHRSSGARLGARHAWMKGSPRWWACVGVPRPGPQPRPTSCAGRG